LVGPAAWLLVGRRWRWVAALALIAGVMLLFVTFSRSAWLGCVAAAGVLAFHHRQFLRGRLFVLAAVALLGLLLILLPLSPLVFTRFAGVNIPTEQESIQDRAWMTEQALLMMRAHPLAGVGIGGFPIELARTDTGTYMIEPVHDLPLLAISELGLPGLLVLAALTVTLALVVRKANGPAAVLLSAVLVGLAVTAVFDHYLWTLAPGRDLLWWALGLWASWVASRGSLEPS
jgi:O-antigen ligase